MNWSYVAISGGGIGLALRDAPGSTGQIADVLLDVGLLRRGGAPDELSSYVAISAAGSVWPCVMPLLRRARATCCWIAGSGDFTKVVINSWSTWRSRRRDQFRPA